MYSTADTEMVVISGNLVEVEYYYTPEVSDCRDEPGTSEDVEIVAVKVAGVDVMDVFAEVAESAGVLEQIEEEIGSRVLRKMREDERSYMEGIAMDRGTMTLVK